MPFISKDWRSPGEEWVKYDGGWERKSIIIDPNPNLNFGFDLIQPASSTNITTTASGGFPIEIKIEIRHFIICYCHKVNFRWKLKPK